MEKSAEKIQNDIVQMRNDLGDTMHALGDKNNMKARAKDVLHEKTDAIKEVVDGAVGRIATGSGDTKEAIKQVSDQAQTLVANAKSKAGSKIGAVQANPLGIALGSLAVGFVIGSLLPARQRR